MDKKPHPVHRLIMETAQQNQLTKPNILCIEDEHFISELYGRAFKKAGLDVTFVYDGLEGYKEARTDKYDIILLDLFVPNMLGLDILAKLRQEVPTLKAKIIITTNLDQGKEKRAEIEKQADGYIIKAELTPRELVEIIKTVPL